MASKLKGGGGGLSGRATKKNTFFCGFPKETWLIKNNAENKLWKNGCKLGL